MQSKLSGLALALCLGGSGLMVSGSFQAAWAQPKGTTKKATVEAGSDKSIEKQSAWEQKVMGEDDAKKNDLKKIAAAQKLGAEARKNPPPEPPKKHKDPNKEGARAKSEASIGLPIESEEAEKARAKKVVAKKAEQPSSDSDELGALVAASLASDKKEAAATQSSSGKKGAKGKIASKGSSPPSALDKMFASP